MKWTIIYEDKMEKVKTSGENKDFGFDINREFYLRSKMFMQRVVECKGGQWLHLMKYNKARKSQRFFFDQETKTIKSVQWKNRSMYIQSNGNGFHVGM